MKLFSTFFNWYFGRNALPYWCIVIFDVLLCLFGGMFVMWLRHPLSEMLGNMPQLMHTFLAFGVANLIGFIPILEYCAILSSMICFVCFMQVFSQWCWLCCLTSQCLILDGTVCLRSSMAA